MRRVGVRVHVFFLFLFLLHPARRRCPGGPPARGPGGRARRSRLPRCRRSCFGGGRCLRRQGAPGGCKRAELHPPPCPARARTIHLGPGERARRSELGLWFGGGEGGGGGGRLTGGIRGGTARCGEQFRRPERLSGLTWALADPKDGETEQAARGSRALLGPVWPEPSNPGGSAGPRVVQTSYARAAPPAPRLGGDGSA